MCTEYRRQSGVTLLELIVFIVIVSVGLAGVLASLNISARGSADPLPPKQALAIAEALLEEILLKDYNDPDGTEAGETRQTYDDVDDFDVPDDASATAVSGDLAGNALPAGYTATVEITTIALGAAAIPARQVVVVVGYPGGQSISLAGIRANY